ncbi:hypothetical protein KR222_001473, partial [Zaprionus bogoriensis]
VVPCYDHVIIVSIYVLLPIGFFGYSYILGIAVSLLYSLFSCITVLENTYKLRELACDICVYTVLNITMVAYQFSMEHSVRQKVLSRRQLLQQNLLLKVVMQTEKNMIETILPPDIANSLQQEIRTRIEDRRLGTHNLTPRFTTHSTLFVELHSDVSILVADMVNYTYLTTRLNVDDLVQILHELFLRFDLAAEENNVLRIKFLGDAYNCVAGIPYYNRRHAKSCVALALEMIEETQNMRDRRNLDINMRIGVHSGEVFSGIIGRTKWQYDIWSRDVDIANRLEQYGLAGAVHISQTTLSLLENTYDYVESSEQRVLDDPILQKAHIRTYLIQSQRSRQASTFPVGDDDSSKSAASSISSSNLADMSISEENVDEIRMKTHHGMIEKVEHMPVGRIQLARIFDFSKETQTENEDYLFRPHISSFWRLFRDSDVEWEYMNQVDILMKYSLLMALFVAIMLLILHASKHWLIICSLLVLIIIITLIGFYQIFWTHFGDSFSTTNLRFFLSGWLLWLSSSFENNLLVRIFVFFCCIFVNYIMASLNTVNCNPHEFELLMIQADVANKPFSFICFDPWIVTDSVICVLTLMLFFHGIPFVFKVGLIFFTCVSHILTINAYAFAWERSETTNLGMPSEYGHIWYVLAFTLMLLVLEQHATYISKVNFHSKLRFEDKLKQTENSTRSIKIIMANILPVHVANIFLDGGRNDELFSENYNKVAVMFAYMHNFEADRGGLRVLNEYICFYDDLLEEYESSTFKVEKIKVIGWTYMAACGLAAENLTEFSSMKATRRKRFRKVSKKRAVRFGSVTHSVDNFSNREPFVPRFTHPELTPDDNCVLTMVRFAQDMLQIMSDIEIQNAYLGHGCTLRGQLRIGISHGPVMAGVVGLSPPHYDIWGHTVNMASRMSSTGVLGSIQVTENTAMVLRLFDIKCDYRGRIPVKGVGETPTYFVSLTDTLRLQHIDDIDLDRINIVNPERRPTA